ncbi:hypothetical protein PNOK_0011100 [Pyrrhoderma noxium]|uniref:Zn(2)-C6 fungal-type domain-containing protein n=1 Tax=Pyrrhoderma noxium TaxID=2282107 RepID=A0A286UTW2_9AGAM|nr:hypothetical protein PNOK_0011000 [Pyrrhoderma noxium]PAV23044.1 hypothetical protein PNOK_0011100 [Pyrrhoderma noxium]
MSSSIKFQDLPFKYQDTESMRRNGGKAIQVSSCEACKKSNARCERITKTETCKRCLAKNTQCVMLLDDEGGKSEADRLQLEKSV